MVVPAHPGAGDQLIFEARQEPGGLVLPVSSSAQVLVAVLGDSQPWAVVCLIRHPGLVERVRSRGNSMTLSLVRRPSSCTQLWSIPGRY